MSGKVLVVDDVDDERIMLKLFLESEGFQVVEAMDGYDAIDKAFEHNPDVVVMDMAMPMMDGIRTTRSLVAKQYFNIPIIGVTGYGDSYDSSAIAAGCTTVLHKPLDLDRFKELLNDLIGPS